MRFPYLCFVALIIAMLGVAPLCSAQRAIEITPFVGAYVPGAASRATASYGCQGVDTYCIEGTAVGQDNAVIGGIRLTASFSRRFATEVGLAYAPSGTASQMYDCPCSANFGGQCFGCSFTTVADASSRLVTGSVLALVTPFLTRPHHRSLYVVAGIDGFHRSGPGFQAAVQAAGGAWPSTDWRPVIGLGARVPVSSSLAFAPRAEFTGHASYVFSLGLSKTLVDRTPGPEGIQGR